MQAFYILLYMLLSAVFIVCIDSFSNNNFPTNNQQHLFANHRQHITRQTSFKLFTSTDENMYPDSTTAQNRLLVFGLGNVGSLVAERGVSLQVDDGVPFFEHVYGTTRTIQDIDGVQSIGFDDYQELKKILSSCTHVLVTIPPLNPPPDIDTNINSNQHYCDPVLNNSTYSIKDILPTNTWIGYISSTSVYGNHDGEWVTENSEVKCEAGTRAEVYLKAENEWITAAKECDWKLHIFRCAGLYSINRSALHTIRKNGVEVIDNASSKKIGSPTSRIHEEDVSRAVLSAMNYNESISGNTNLWNLADDEPEVRSKVMAYGAQLLEEANLLPKNKKAESSSTQIVTKTTTKPKQSERASRRSIDRKRVDAQRMKELLLPDGKLIYPTYREGLKSILDSNRMKWSSDSEKIR